jgi:hypothetical protein
MTAVDSTTPIIFAFLSTLATFKKNSDAALRRRVPGGYGHAGPTCAGTHQDR